MAIPFYEPKTTPTTPANNNNSSNSSLEIDGQSVNQMHYDQVDGLLLNDTQHYTTATPVTLLPTAMPHSLAQIAVISMNHGPTTTIPITTSASTTPMTLTTPPITSIEQQAWAWKILALTLCKALKEYHLKTASPKDEFTNQTVQMLPNGDIQPLWK